MYTKAYFKTQLVHNVLVCDRKLLDGPNIEREVQTVFVTRQK